MAVALRLAIALAIAVVSILGIRWERDRWSLHSRKLAIERTTEELKGRGSQTVRARFAKSALEQLHGRHRYPLDVDLRLEAAAAFRLVSQFEAAEQEYRAALRVSDRPEIHIALGDLFVEVGDDKSAVEHYSDAVQFSQHYMRYIQFHKVEVLRRVEERERALAEATQ